MKNSKLFLAFICGLALSSIFAFTKLNDDKKGLANVVQIDGKYVFMNCTPVQPYETAFEFKTSVGGMGCPTISDMAQAVVKSAKKKGFPFDAIIAGDTKFDLAIKFK